MKLIESIKLLKPAERFKALVFIGLLSAFTTLMTVYLRGNPCEKITAQYSQQLDNYAKLAETNNYLMASDNAKQQAIIRLHSLLAKLDSAGKVSETQWVEVTTPIQTKTVTQVKYVQVDHDGIAMADVRPSPPVDENPLPKTITTKHAITIKKSLSPVQKNILDSALTLTDIYIQKTN